MDYIPLEPSPWIVLVVPLVLALLLLIPMAVASQKKEQGPRTLVLQVLLLFGFGGLIILGILGYFKEYDDDLEQQQDQVKALIEDTYGFELSEEDIEEVIYYPRAEPTRDFSIYGSVMVPDSKVTQEGDNEAYLVWRDGQFILAFDTNQFDPARDLEPLVLQDTKE